MYHTGLQSKHTYITEKKVRAVEFGLLDPDEILKISVANINSERIYDEATLFPKMNAVNDPRMGIMTRE